MSVPPQLWRRRVIQLKRSFLIITSAVLFLKAPLDGAEFNALPEVIQSSVAMLSQSGSASAYSVSVVAGESFFNVQISRDGASRVWSFDEKGVPVNVSLTEKELPPAVRNSFQAEAKAGRVLIGLQRSYEDGKPLFEARWKTGKQEFSTFAHADGSLAAREIDRAELPPAIKKQLAGKWSSERVDRCFRSQEKGGAYFTVTIASAQSPRWITFDSDGDVAEEEERLEWSRVPEKVGNAVREKLHSTEHVRVLKRTEDEDEIYEIWALTPERLVIFWVDPEGEVSEQPPNGANQ